MKQILQNLKSGETELVDIPVPQVRPGHILIQSRTSVVSAGTERMLVEFGKANMIDKARQQPEKVKQVLDKVKTDGLAPTINAVKTKLDQPLPLGYSNAGVVIAVGKGVDEFQVGDRVISNGNHAEIVSVPKNICAKIPEGINDEDAAFTVIGSIGLQGIRLAQPSLGETFVVTGLGLIGLITVQLLKAHGCRVLALDFEKNKLELAMQFGAEVVDLSTGLDPVEVAKQYSKGRGVDGVIITASTKSNEPVHQAAQMCRKRGRIILVGVVGLELLRSDFYEKELTFQVSCSYGPGRYDTNYEEKGQDYPFGFVRWTEQRNFEAILDMIADKKVNFEPLITHQYKIEEAVEAYKTLSEDKTSIGILLKYPEKEIEYQAQYTVPLINKQNINRSGKAVVGFIGAGNFTNQVLLPAVKGTDAQLKTIASSGGVNGVHVGKRFEFEETTTYTDAIYNDSDINTVFVTTRHNSHAELVKKAIQSGKHVFVEKPLCLTRDQLQEIQQLDFSKQMLMVGFNRRFSPHVKKMKELLSTVTEPKTMVFLANAGYIPLDHWTQDHDVGGGRIIGEACHYIDLLRYLVGSPIIDVQAAMIGDIPGVEIREDKMTITLLFQDGSLGTIHYFANGHKSFPKEKLDVFAGGKVLSLNNFKTLEGYGWSNFKKMKLMNQDKGHKDEVKAFIDAVKNGGNQPIPLEEIFEVTKVTFDVMDQVKKVDILKKKSL